MIFRLRMFVGLWFAALLFAAAPVRADTSLRVVAVGDLHGDYEAWIAIARSAGLIDSRNRWAGGKTVFVQMGDLADRGPDSLKIIRHLQALQKDAPRAGGKVIVLVGNHEAMNVTGDLRYVHPGEYAAFTDRRSEDRRADYYRQGRERIEADYRTVHPEWTDEQIKADFYGRTPLGMIEHRRAWSPDGDVGRWVVGLPTVAKVGDSLFVHGGLSPSYASVGIEEINRRVSAAMKAGETGPESILRDERGPLWYRGLAARPTPPAASPESTQEGTAQSLPPLTLRQEADALLSAFDVKRIVIGHTPQLGGIVFAEDGKIARIDTGISAHYGGVLSWLEIADGRAVARTVPRPSREGGR